ncbi:MAG: hypothetical protein ABI433_07250 [Burkholderiaceae bacterium]
MGAGMVATVIPGVFMRRSRVEVGRKVRATFGSEARDGEVVHIAANGAIHVRFNPGWVEVFHTADELQPLEFVASDFGALL